MRRTLDNKKHSAGYESLACAVVYTAIYDYKRGNVYDRDRINREMNSDLGKMFLALALPESQLTWDEIKEYI